MRRLAVMGLQHCTRALAMVAIGSAIACGSPGPLPTSTTATNDSASIAIVGLTATSKR